MKSKLRLKKQSTINDYQFYVKELELERGFQNEKLVQKCLLLGEEIGELYEIVVDPKKKGAEDELADILIVLLTIINRLTINFEEYFESKKLFKEKATLPIVQQYLKKNNKYNKNAASLCLLLGQNVGNLYKTVRKKNKITKIDFNSNFIPINEILMEILLNLCGISNYFGISLEKAFREKEKKNKNRKWQ